MKLEDKMKLIDEAVRIVMQKPEYLKDIIKEKYCPIDYGIESQKDSCKICNDDCTECWKREYNRNPAERDAHEGPQIKDSGERREFSSGAVRDIQEGKGRCDLLPLDVAGDLFEEPGVMRFLEDYVRSHDEGNLVLALEKFITIRGWDTMTMLLEVSIHMEEGAKKYGERNWEKGIPAHCYIDSAVRHYLKWRRGDTDERHDRAFCWNILCLMWTMRHKPECNDLLKTENKDGK